MIHEVVSKVLSFLDLGAHISDSQDEFRRQHIRYSGFHAEAMVGNRTYSIRDWSLGGLVFDAMPDMRLTIGDKITISLKFRLPHETVTIQQPAFVVRTAKRAIAARFTPLNKDIRRQFDRVLDGLQVQSFLESQSL